MFDDLFVQHYFCFDILIWEKRFWCLSVWILHIPSCIRLPDRLDGVLCTLLYKTNYDGGNATLQYRSFIAQLDVKTLLNHRKK